VEKVTEGGGVRAHSPIHVDKTHSNKRKGILGRAERKIEKGGRKTVRHGTSLNPSPPGGGSLRGIKPRGKGPGARRKNLNPAFNSIGNGG